MTVKVIKVGYQGYRLDMFMDQVSYAGRGMAVPVVTADQNGGEVYVYDQNGLSEDDVILLNYFMRQRIVVKGSIHAMEDSFDNLWSLGYITQHEGDETYEFVLKTEIIE